MKMELLVSAIKSLHARKNEGYGVSWKRRGEQISIMANVARKVDRLEHLTGGKIAAKDESIIDTAVDLLVYLVKYQTFLAEMSLENAKMVFGEGVDGIIGGKYSDRIECFDLVLSEAFSRSRADSSGADEIVTQLAAVFESLYGYFAPPIRSSKDRLELVQALTVNSVHFLLALHRLPGYVEQFDTYIQENLVNG